MFSFAPIFYVFIIVFCYDYLNYFCDIFYCNYQKVFAKVLILFPQGFRYNKSSESYISFIICVIFIRFIIGNIILSFGSSLQTPIVCMMLLWYDTRGTQRQQIILLCNRYWLFPFISVWKLIRPLLLISTLSSSGCNFYF